jgi:hypothetical protein
MGSGVHNIRHYPLGAALARDRSKRFPRTLWYCRRIPVSLACTPYRDIQSHWPARNDLQDFPALLLRPALGRPTLLLELWGRCRVKWVHTPEIREKMRVRVRSVKRVLTSCHSFVSRVLPYPEYPHTPLACEGCVKVVQYVQLRKWCDGGGHHAIEKVRVYTVRAVGQDMEKQRRAYLAARAFVFLSYVH